MEYLSEPYYSRRVEKKPYMVNIIEKNGIFYVRIEMGEGSMNMEANRLREVAEKQARIVERRLEEMFAEAYAIEDRSEEYENY